MINFRHSLKIKLCGGENSHIDKDLWGSSPFLHYHSNTVRISSYIGTKLRNNFSWCESWRDWLSDIVVDMARFKHIHLHGSFLMICWFSIYVFYLPKEIAFVTLLLLPTLGIRTTTRLKWTRMSITNFILFENRFVCKDLVEKDKFIRESCYPP